MNSPLTAGDIMTRNIATITAHNTLLAAINLMLERKISGLPVIGPTGAIVGILTEGDLLRRIELDTGAHHASWLDFFREASAPAKHYVAAHSHMVGDVMTKTVLTVDEGMSLAEVVDIMQSKHVKRVPVLASGGTLLGIISRSDLLRALSDTFAPTFDDPPPTDAMIRDDVLAEFSRQPWMAGSSIQVKVVDGAVDLDGVIVEEAERSAIRVAAQNVHGVTLVNDHLVRFEP